MQLVGTRPNGEILAPWIISLEQIRAGLQVTRQVTGDDLRFEVSVDLGAFARYLGTLSPSLSTVPADGRFDYDPLKWATQRHLAFDQRAQAQGRRDDQAFWNWRSSNQ